MYELTFLKIKRISKYDLDKAKEWIAKGAKPSDRISIFLSNLGVMDKPVITEKTKKHLPKKKTQERLAAAKEKEKEKEAKPAEEPKEQEDKHAEEPKDKKHNHAE
mgnify:CR=1 FL=1